MAISRWGAPAPSGPPMAVEEPKRWGNDIRSNENPQPFADVSYIPVRATAASIRDQLQARAEELRKDIAALSDKQAELALIERMLEVK